MPPSRSLSRPLPDRGSSRTPKPKSRSVRSRVSDPFASRRRRRYSACVAREATCAEGSAARCPCAERPRRRPRLDLGNCLRDHWRHRRRPFLHWLSLPSSGEGPPLVVGPRPGYSRLGKPHCVADGLATHAALRDKKKGRRQRPFRSPRRKFSGQPPSARAYRPCRCTASGHRSSRRPCRRTRCCR